MKKVILASASKRRSSILKDCNIKHFVIPSGAEEIIASDLHVSEVVRINAEKKAEQVAENQDSAIIIAADTLVAHGSDIIGKPASEKEAKDMLKRFSGQELEVYTGLCVIEKPEEKKVSATEKSSLTVVRLSDEKIERYFRLLGPYDKAGGFSIEGVGSLLFDNIQGSYFNILGLSMIKLNELFKEIGLEILDYIGA
ncbi:MAG: Maf family protein [Candidatus Omnitrophota bacterium]